MNKKLFLGMFAAAGMLLATSCSTEELEMVQSGNEAQVTFSLATEGGIASRAISDGTGAKKLIYAVYNANGELIKTIDKADANGQIIDNAAFDNGLTDQVTITLAKGQQYTVAFWAQNPNCTAYTTTDLENVEINYAGLNNDETRDAFFKTETFTVTGDADIDVVLKRPFAQINVGVYQTDWDAAIASEIEIEKSKVTITNAATSINLLTGEVDGEETVEYGFATIPAQFSTPETLDVDLDKDGTKEKYVYLSMCYILANDATTGYAKTTLEDLDFTFAPKSGNNITFNDIKFNQGLTAVPVQRNWRTNIIGKILTGDITFNITIDPIYDGEYNNGEAQPVNINGVYYATIQDAVDAVKAGEVINVSTGTYTEVVNVTGGKNFTLEAAGPNVVIAGIDHQTNGTASTVKVKGVTIDNSLANGWFTGTSPKIAPCVGAWGGHLSFEDCAFIVAGTSGKETGVMTWWTTDKTMTLSFNNCTFDGKDDHQNARAMQIYGSVNMEVSNCTFNTKKDYTLKYVANKDKVATFTNNTVNNSENFVELGSSAYPGDGYTVNIMDNTLGEGVNTHVIANQENQTVNVNGNVSVIASGLTKDENGNYAASSNGGIEAAMDLNEKDVTVVLTEDVTVDVTAWASLEFGGDQSETITIDGNGKTLTFNHKNGDWNNITTANGAKLIIKNAHITNSGSNNGPWNRHDLNFACEVELTDVISDKAIALAANATLTNVTINDKNTSDTYALWVKPNGQTVTLNGCVIDMIDCSDGRGISINDQYVDSPAKVTLNVSNTVFKTEEKSAIIVKSTAGADITLNNVDITAVSADNVNAVWVDADRSAAYDLVNVVGGTKFQEQ